MLYMLALRRPVLVDGNRLPRYWAAVWAMFHGGGIADETLKGKLRHIDALYEYAESTDINLDDVLGYQQFEKLENLLEAFFVCIRNRPNPSNQAINRWNTAFHFARDTCMRVTKTPTKKSNLHEINIRVARLDQLYLGLRPRKKKNSTQIRSVPRKVIAEALDKIMPGATGNPFSGEATQWRVFCLFVLMLYQGLRRGETLVLKADSLRWESDPGGRRRWFLKVPFNQTEADPRAQAPSVKTVDSLRTLPVTETTAGIIQAYLENYRGKVNHSYLLSSRRNLPLSLEGVTKIFHKISTSISEDARNELHYRTGAANLTPHALRHTCAVARMKQLLNSGQTVEQAMQQLRAFFGWSKTSKMPLHYARTALDELLNEKWNDSLDERINFLKSIPK